MDIRPINSLNSVVESAVHDERPREEKRKPPRKQEKIAPAPVYTPDGRLDEKQASNIDIVA